MTPDPAMLFCLTALALVLATLAAAGRLKVRKE